MGVLANHVPSIEQLKPGLVEIIEESGGSKQFFRTFDVYIPILWASKSTIGYVKAGHMTYGLLLPCDEQYLEASLSCNLARS